MPSSSKYVGSQNRGRAEPFELKSLLVDVDFFSRALPKIVHGRDCLSEDDARAGGLIEGGPFFPSGFVPTSSALVPPSAPCTGVRLLASIDGMDKLCDWREVSISDSSLTSSRDLRDTVLVRPDADSFDRRAPGVPGPFGLLELF